MRRGFDEALDEYLVLSAQAGAAEAFAHLARRWGPKLEAFAARVLADQEAARDVVQETWTSAWRGLGALDDPARFRAWLYAIAHRKCTDVLRGKYRRGRLQSAMERIADEDGGDEEARASARLDVEAALLRLPTDQRIAAALYFGEGLSLAEIAHATGASIGAVKSRLFTARHALRALLQSDLP